MFEPDNPESLANALDRYIGGNSFETMSPEVQKHAEKYLWTERGANIMGFIRENADGKSEMMGFYYNFHN